MCNVFETSPVVCNFCVRAIITRFFMIKLILLVEFYLLLMCYI